MLIVTALIVCCVTGEHYTAMSRLIVKVLKQKVVDPANHAAMLQTVTQQFSRNSNRQFLTVWVEHTAANHRIVFKLDGVKVFYTPQPGVPVRHKQVGFDDILRAVVKLKSEARCRQHKAIIANVIVELKQLGFTR